MSHISTLRSLCHSSFLCANPIVERSLLFSSLLPKQRALLSCQSSPVPVFGCTGGRGRGQPGGGGSGGFQRRRGSSTLREKSKESAPLRVPEMEEKEAVAGYNKRRAEGRDKRDTTRTMQLKTRKLNPVNTTCYVQILGTGMDTQDTSPSVFLFFDKQRFIFNAGEGLQRFCTEHKIKLSKVDHLFLTRVSSETAGGLPGLLLTLAGIGEEGMSVNIWGPSDLDFLVNAMRSFIPNAAMVHTHSFGETQNGNGGLGSSMYPIALIDDEVVRLSAISLKPNSSPASLMKPGDIAVVYICELPEIKGKFDPEKAAACGLKPGPKYRELQLGNSVMSDSLNIMVHPCDVLGPSVPGPIVLLVDCPTASHMAELFDAKSLNCYYVDVPDCQREHSKLVNCMIHLGPAAVTKTLDYQNWMKRFGRTQHIMAGHEMKNMAIPILKSSARIASRLNYLSPQLFPAPEFWSQKDCSSAVSCEIPTSNCVDIVAAENLLKFHLRPYSHIGLDKSAIPTSLDREHIVKELLSEIPEVEDVCRSISQFWKDLKPMKNVKKYVMEEPWIESSHLPNDKHWNEDLNEVSDAPACLNNVSREDMEIVLLGTGSSQPSKYRNVSSIFINLFSKGSLLLDCGEGTLAQLKRRFGVEGADKAVRSLKCIWVSHIHADHHTGLARILALRCQLLKDVPHEPLLVIGPLPLKRFLDAYSRLEDLDMLFLDCRHTIEPYLETIAGREALDGKETNLFARGGGMQSYWMKPGSPVGTDASRAILRRLKEVLREAGLESLNSVPVVHCPQAFAVVLKAEERINCVGRVVPGWKVVYSGDTRPCQSLIDASRDATVLIHEATFEDGLGEEAVSRNHSTTSEAIRVGSTAGAYRVILTHFSQRYPKIPVFDEIHMHNTCIAFDLMSVNLADLPLLPKVLPYLKVLFKNDANIDEPEDVVDLAVIQY